MQKLRYKISDWIQLRNCLSNNSRELRIHVNQISDQPRLSGTVISVVHPSYGVLFSTTTKPSGLLANVVEELTTKQILTQLNMFGFDITFEEERKLKGSQISYLMTLSNLGYKKIGPLAVTNPKTGLSKFTVVAYDGDKHPAWLTPVCKITEGELLCALADGTTINVSAMTAQQKFPWTWLTYAANIDDIIAENSRSNDAE